MSLSKYNDDDEDGIERRMKKMSDWNVSLNTFMILTRKKFKKKEKNEKKKTIHIIIGILVNNFEVSNFKYSDWISLCQISTLEFLLSNSYKKLYDL